MMITGAGAVAKGIQGAVQGSRLMAAAGVMGGVRAAPAAATVTGVLEGAAVGAYGTANIQRSTGGSGGKGGGGQKGSEASGTRMLGERGTKVTSKTVWKEGKARLNVENPNPGQRPGQIHYQGGNKKYLYDPETGTFPEAPQSVNDLLKNEEFAKGIQKGLKYLGEWYMRMNQRMKFLVANMPFSSISGPPSPTLNDMLIAGVTDVDGCVLLKRLLEDNRHLDLSKFPGRTACEALVNKIHIEDWIPESDRLLTEGLKMRGP